MTESTSSLAEALKATSDRQWRQLAAAGTWWTGEQRVAIAAAGRSARTRVPPAASGLPDNAAEAAMTIAASARTLDQARIEAWVQGGLSPPALVELLSVTARTCAIDTFFRGYGEDPLPLPNAEEGEPSRTTVEGAALNHGWLPTRGPAGAPNCFSAVEAEHQSMQALHADYYLGLPEMRSLDLVKELHRAQIELLASRTSYLNDCFY